MKTIYLEKWECVRSSYGKLYKLDLGKIAEEEMYPELLEMDNEELTEWIEENDELLCEPEPLVASVCCESDPDHYEQTVYTNPKDALDSIEWQGFNRGYPGNDMSPDDAQNKDAIIENLKKKLEEFTKEP